MLSRWANFPPDWCFGEGLEIDPATARSFSPDAIKASIESPKSADSPYRRFWQFPKTLSWLRDAGKQSERKKERKVPGFLPPLHTQRQDSASCVFRYTSLTLTGADTQTAGVFTLLPLLHYTHGGVSGGAQRLVGEDKLGKKDEEEEFGSSFNSFIYSLQR